MAPIKPLSGMVFGRLTVLGLLPERCNGKLIWLCRCECGTDCTATGEHLKNGNTKSCGCLCREMALAKQPLASRASIKALTKHGQSRVGRKSFEYSVWANMLTRCSNAKVSSYKDYGGRGITVCERWKDFQNFFADMGKCPEGRSIDRVNNDGNYEPGNCRWATQKEQASNKRKESWSRNTSEAIKKHWILRKSRKA